jgi:elongation factor Ts
MLCETDFAAKPPKFGALVDSMLDGALKIAADGDVAAAVNEQEAAVITSHIATIGENMSLRRAQKWQSANGSVFASYHHMDGRVSVLVEVEGESDPEFLNDLCLHIAAFSPRYVSSADVPAEVIQKEKEIAAAADPKLANKPAEMLDKILAGKINRFFSEICLEDQPWVKDDKSSMKKLKPNAKVKRFVRWAIGEEL